MSDVLLGARAIEHQENDQDNPDLVTGDELTRDDWDDLKTIFQILKPFRHWTLQLQGTGTQRNHANGYLARVLPTIDHLLAHLEDAKQAYSDSSINSSHLLTSINNAWAILDRYVPVLFCLYYSVQVIFTLMPGYSSFINIKWLTNLGDRYYSLADRVPVLYAAVGLVPAPSSSTLKSNGVTILTG